MTVAHEARARRSVSQLIGSVHALHQRARNVTRTGVVGEARKGLIEAVDDVL
jgi:hypothetical protein